jgi:hypothetical protein
LLPSENKKIKKRIFRKPEDKLGLSIAKYIDNKFT